MDFSAHGRYLIASCEFDSKLIKVDVESQKLVGTLELGGHTMPQDVKLSPDGRVFYVADMMANGVHLIDGDHARSNFYPRARGHTVQRQPRFQGVTPQPRRGKRFASIQIKKAVQKWWLPGGAAPIWAGVR
jgi:hypothetical protein